MHPEVHQCDTAGTSLDTCKVASGKKSWQIFDLNKLQTKQESSQL